MDRHHSKALIERIFSNIFRSSRFMKCCIAIYVVAQSTVSAFPLSLQFMLLMEVFAMKTIMQSRDLSSLKRQKAFCGT